MKKLPITKGFQRDLKSVIGEIGFINPDEIAKLLASGEFTFASSFLKDKDGKLTLIEISLIPAEMAIRPTLRAVDPPSALMGGDDSENSAGN